MTEQVRVESPSSFATRFVKYLVGFGVWFAVGLAPFLGKLKVPGFAALIELYPKSMQDWVVPLSGLFMGMIGVVVQFTAAHDPARTKVRRWFARAAAAFLIAFLLLTGVYLFTVTRVDRSTGGGGVTSLAVVTGTRTVPANRSSRCACGAGEPATECLPNISLRPANVESCFGTERVLFATLSLVLLYFAVTGSFAAAVGLLLITERQASAPKKSRADADTPHRSPAP